MYEISILGFIITQNPHFDYLCRPFVAVCNRIFKIFYLNLYHFLSEKCQSLCRIIHSLQRCNDRMLLEYSKLKSLYTYHQSSCYKQVQAPTSSPFDATNSEINYSIRSIRLHLHASLLL